MRNGESTLSDNEWALIEPMLLIGRQTVYDRRQMLDGILAKLCTGRPWRKVAYPVGNYSNAVRVYASLRSSGTWARVVEVVMARGDSEVALRPATENVDEPYVRLSDAEWEQVQQLGLRTNGSRKYDLRASIDLVLAHELNGESWKKESYVGGSINRAAQKRSVVWRRNGRLERLLDAVRAMRGAGSD